MSYFRHGDPLDDFDRYDKDLARQEAKLPVCEKCNHPITDDIYFDIEGEILCRECMEDKYMKIVEDCIGGGQA